MTKKEYLRILFTKLAHRSEYAIYLSILLDSRMENSEMIDKIYGYFSEKIKHISNQKEHNHFLHVLQNLEKIKKLEDDDKIDDDDISNFVTFM